LASDGRHMMFLVQEMPRIIDDCKVPMMAVFINSLWHFEVTEYILLINRHNNAPLLENIDLFGPFAYLFMRSEQETGESTKS
jgi:hypothetical protein